MLDMLITQQCHPGFEDRIELLLRRLEGNTVANDEGCRRYEWYRAPEPQTYVLIERWTNIEAATAHVKADHFTAVMREARNLIASPHTKRALLPLGSDTDPEQREEMQVTRAPLDIIVTQRCYAGFEERFEALLPKVERDTVANDEGCLRYEWYRAPEPQTYVLVERWTSMEAAQSHLKSEHFQAIGPEMQACVPERFSIRQLTRVSPEAADEVIE